MTIRPAEFGSPEYAATVELRREVLRRPLGLDFTAEQLAAENADTHLALISDAGEICACLVLTPKDALTLKMRQVAVHPSLQGQGLGRKLVEASEQWARQHDFNQIVLNARDTAVPFYAAQNYAVEGDPFEEVGIPHRAMRKLL